MLVVIVMAVKQIQELLWRTEPELVAKTLYGSINTNSVPGIRIFQVPISKVKTAELNSPIQKHVVQQAFSGPINAMALHRSHLVVG